jgi:farnesol dehydrogenase
MPILITGSTGYIGSILTARLAEQGETIRILCRKDPGVEAFNKPNIEKAWGDITDRASLDKAMKGVDRIYHLAAYARLWSKHPATFSRINVEGTRHVLESALAHGVRKVVYTSTAGVIGPSADKPMNEDMPRITGFFNPYEETKAEAEAIALGFQSRGLAVSIVNPSRVYGPGLDTGSNPVTKVAERYIKGQWKLIPGSGKDIGSYCFIDDVVEGHMLAMSKGRPGQRYIFGGVNASFNELMDTIRRWSGIQIRLRHIPFPVLLLFSQVQLMRANLTGKPPLITPDWVRKYKYDWALDSNKAVQELGYHIRPLDEGIQKTIEWLKEHRKA